MRVRVALRHELHRETRNRARVLLEREANVNRMAGLPRAPLERPPGQRGRPEQRVQRGGHGRGGKDIARAFHLGAHTWKVRARAARSNWTRAPCGGVKGWAGLIVEEALMHDDLTATANITIDASLAKVWDALINPEVIKRYMFGATVVSDWKQGSPITVEG